MDVKNIAKMGPQSLGKTIIPELMDSTLKPEAVEKQVKLINDLQKLVMKEGIHYGTIQGTKTPTLYKAGSEKLCLCFRLAPRYKIETIDLEGGHREIRVITSLTHIITGAFCGEGVGACSTMEPKYRYRNKALKCPACGQETIFTAKENPEFFCWKKKGGCGVKFDILDPKIVDQKIGKVENPDPAELWNTVLKMAKKRSLSDAVLTSTAASDMYLQDRDEDADPAAGSRPEPVARTTKAAQKPPIQTKSASAKEKFDTLWEKAIKSGKVDLQEEVGNIIQEFAHKEEALKEDWSNAQYAQAATEISKLLKKYGFNV